MTSSVGSRELPRPVLFAAGVLLVLALLIAAFGNGKTTDTNDATPIVASYEISLTTREDGSILPRLTDGRAKDPRRLDVGLFGSDNARIFADLWRAADVLAGNGGR